MAALSAAYEPSASASKAERAPFAGPLSTPVLDAEPVSALIELLPLREGAPLTDAELVKALLRADPRAPRLAVERFSPMVRGVLRRGLGNDGEVEDALQEVFICLFRRLPSLRDPLSLRPFVLAIAVNTAMHERRRRQRRSILSFAHEPTLTGVAGASGAATANYALARLSNLLRRLTARDRTTFQLRYVEGCTAVEVAQQLGVSEPTARRSFMRAWRRVRVWAARDPFLADYLASNPLPPIDEDCTTAG